MANLIFHIDVNSAFLSWEAVYRLHHLGATVDLRKIPAAVGGDVSKRHGIILARSIPAKRMGVKTGESVPEALCKCPELVLVPPNYSLYEKNSRAFRKILHEYSGCVEAYSIDECFMDMTGTKELFGSPVMAARSIADRIHRELGFTVNVGISSTKVLAKMASDFQKPDQVHTLFPEEIPKKLWPLPVEDLFFVGRASARKLKLLGIHTIGELAHTDVGILRSHMRSHGEVIWNYANGRDSQEVQGEKAPNKGYGNSTTVAFDVCRRETAARVLLSLAETVGWRLRKDQVEISLVSVGIRYYDLSYTSHQQVLRHPTQSTLEIYEQALELFDALWDGTPIRHLSIHTQRVIPENGYCQLALPWMQGHGWGRCREDVDYSTTIHDREKQVRMERTMDEIRRRFGPDTVKRASFLIPTREKGMCLDHLGGGISREKKTVDYKKEMVI